jgi:hypothetical protein
MFQIYNGGVKNCICDTAMLLSIEPDRTYLIVSSFATHVDRGFVYHIHFVCICITTNLMPLILHIVLKQKHGVSGELRQKYCTCIMNILLFYYTTTGLLCTATRAVLCW